MRTELGTVNIVVVVVVVVDIFSIFSRLLCLCDVVCFTT